MDRNSYAYADLAVKYKGFDAPHFQVEIDGDTLAQQSAHITSAQVVMEADNDLSGSLSLTIDTAQRPGSQARVADLDGLVPFAPVKLRAGYAQSGRSLLFQGYIDQVHYEYDRQSQSGCRIQVTALDAKALLEKDCGAVFFGEKKLAQCVQDLLGKLDKRYVSATTVGALADRQAQWIKREQSDLSFLKEVARDQGVHFFVLKGEAVFDGLLKKGEKLITLRWGESLMQFEKKENFDRAIRQVTLVSESPALENRLSATADRPSLPGFDAQDWEARMTKRNAKCIVLQKNELLTQQELADTAQAYLNWAALESVSGSGQCVGLPELIPGRWFEVGGMDGESNGSYFLTKVTHQLGEDGYLTAFEFKGAKA